MDISQVDLFKYVPSAEVISCSKNMSWDKQISLTFTFVEEVSKKPMEMKFSQGITWQMIVKDSFISVFNEDITSDPTNFIGKKVSLVIYTGADKPEALFIGLENEKPLLNRSQLTYDDFESLSSYTYMKFKVPANTKTTHRSKTKI